MKCSDGWPGGLCAAIPVHGLGAALMAPGIRHGTRSALHFPRSPPHCAAERGQRSGLTCGGTRGRAGWGALVHLDPPAPMTSGLYGRSTGAPVRMSWGISCVTGDDRSCSRHTLLCGAFGRLCNSHPRLLFASECNLATAISLQTSEDILCLYSYPKQFKSAKQKHEALGQKRLFSHFGIF